MKARISVASVLSLILISSLLSVIEADSLVVVPVDDETILTPIAFGNQSETYPYEMSMSGMCVSDTDITFTSNVRTLWELYRTIQPTSLRAWDSNGNLLWTSEYSTWSFLPGGLVSDDTFLFATGASKGNLSVRKFDHQGSSVWNVTRDFGGGERGYTIDITMDGTIVVKGTTEELANNSNIGYFLITFDHEGQELWHKMFQSEISFSCSSNHIFVAGEGFLQKYRTDGTLVWERSAWCFSRVYSRGNALYTIEYPIHNYSALIAFNMSSRNVTRWNALTGEKIWTKNIGICDSNHQEYCGYSHPSIVANGSLVLLVVVQELEWSYLLMVSQRGDVFYKARILDSSWSFASIEVGSSGLIHIAGEGTFGQGVALFDLGLPEELPREGLNYPLIAIVAASVAFFDAGLIMYMRKRAARM